MELQATFLERIELAPVHGAKTRTDKAGFLILSDSDRLDWHLLRCTNPRLARVKVRLTMIIKPAPTCNTTLYVHHWGNQDICSIDQHGTVVLNQSRDDIVIEHRSDGFMIIRVAFENRHPTLNIGTGKPRGWYRGSGTDQYYIESISAELSTLHHTRSEIIDRIWQGRDPFDDLPENLFEFDLQGWNSQHHFLSDTISDLRPRVIVEVGVWKGGSTVFMANELQKLALPSVIIAVDTWLGSSEHWAGNSISDLSIIAGRPAIYYKFLSNVAHSDVSDFVVPFPIDSLNAAEVLRLAGIRPDMIHLDGGHDYNSVIADLRAWWPLLAPGGALIGDDYFDNGTWPSVRKAFDDFFGVLHLVPIKHADGKCYVAKSS